MGKSIKSSEQFSEMFKEVQKAGSQQFTGYARKLYREDTYKKTVGQVRTSRGGGVWGTDGLGGGDRRECIQKRQNFQPGFPTDDASSSASSSPPYRPSPHNTFSPHPLPFRS